MRPPLNVLAAAGVLLPASSAFSFAPKARHSSSSSSSSSSVVTTLRMNNYYGDEYCQISMSNIMKNYHNDNSNNYYDGNNNNDNYDNDDVMQNNNNMDMDMMEELNLNLPPLPSSRRRGLLSQLAAGSILLASAGSFAAPLPALALEAAAGSTKLEINVDTEYLLRVLDYFDGDMRKVLGVLVKSPDTKVMIDPPEGSNRNEARDAILRALYSYEQPDEYAVQASWIKVDQRSSWSQFVDFMTKKRYNYSFDADKYAYLRQDALNTNVGRAYTASGSAEPKFTTISLSNLDAGLGLAVASYPMAYAYYEYESIMEEKEKAAKKEAMALKKKAAAAKAKAAAAKTEGGTKEKPPAKEKKEKKMIKASDLLEKKEPTFAEKLTENVEGFFAHSLQGEDPLWQESTMSDIMNGKQPGFASEEEEVVAAVVEVPSPPVAEPSLAMVEETLAEEQQPQPPAPVLPTPSYVTPAPKKVSRGGMDAYAAQMAAMMAPPSPETYVQDQTSMEEPSYNYVEESVAAVVEESPNKLRAMAQNASGAPPKKAYGIGGWKK